MTFVQPIVSFCGIADTKAGEIYRKIEKMLHNKCSHLTTLSLPG